MRIAIISAADSRYAGLALGLFQSIARVGRPADAECWLLDCGLEPADMADFQQLGINLVAPGDDYPHAPITARWFRAMKARPNLPKWIPGYDIYLWIDADAWVQERAALDLLIEGARRHGVAAVPERDEAYAAELYSPEAGKPVAVQDITREIFADLFGDDNLARQMANEPCINSGVFAARAEPDFWALWADTAGKLMRPGVRYLFYSEQTALNYVIRSGAVAAVQLPSWCNWLCNMAVPTLTADGSRFVHPHRPAQRIGILHMAGPSKDGYQPTVTEDGAPAMVRLPYRNSAL